MGNTVSRQYGPRSFLQTKLLGPVKNKLTPLPSFQNKESSLTKPHPYARAHLHLATVAHLEEVKLNGAHQRALKHSYRAACIHPSLFYEPIFLSFFFTPGWSHPAPLASFLLLVFYFEVDCSTSTLCLITINVGKKFRWHKQQNSRSCKLLWTPLKCFRLLCFA